jgi:hypothetical protein
VMFSTEAVVPSRLMLGELAARTYICWVRMFMEPGGPHHTPHLHAYYQDDVGIFSIDPIELIAGSLPKRQRRLVEAWAELHQAELAADWERCNKARHQRQ